ncbi:S8 family peptidase [Arcobacter sp. FWKO B]|uniref:S8 family peptidase n=1 Tax=Arcobacter sp. FWKO B TaxID=2593672 RepID=UPI0018A65D21|nr:S8 family peptidase [Arcobacter sp. FWKO B]QOG11835.1 S8 family peptidase [Arcobacter sp. FWKO B]
MPDLRPLFIGEQYKTDIRFTSPQSGGGDSTLPYRNAPEHGNRLYGKLQSLLTSQTELISENESLNKGIYIEVLGVEGIDLNIEPLESSSKDIRLSNFKNTNPQKATLFLPLEKKDFLEKKIKEYIQKLTKKGNPKHNDLIAVIEDFKTATINSFWNGKEDKIPSETKIWCEVWLMNNKNTHDEDVISEFINVTQTNNIEIRTESNIKFPERIITLAKLNAEDILNLIDSYQYLAEIRPYSTPNIAYTSMEYHDQKDWVSELKDRIIVNPDSKVSICILDTGVNNVHPLLEDILKDEDKHTFLPSWDINDHDSHGTEMSGIAAYGNLNEHLSGIEDVELNHTLASFKILPPTGSTEKSLWGYITEQAVAIREIEKPNKIHVYSMSVTAKDTDGDVLDGTPSSWSSAIDSILYNNDYKKLFCISVGNTDIDDSSFEYKNTNLKSPIENPAQSWNALSIGAFTQKDTITDEDGTYASYDVVMAEKDEISPFTTTSHLWDRQWCIKPDVVFEGGNLLLNTIRNDKTTHDDLALLTTHSNIYRDLITWTYATSAANALGANFVARLYATFPEATPETIRGLVIHSAKWTDEMFAQFKETRDSDRDVYKKLLRTCGYGVPDFDKAVNCYTNSLTLIAEDTIQPFIKIGNDIKTNVMNLYTLPWPKEALEDLGSQEVEMRVTLSYFIEPAPTEMVVSNFNRYNYPSHGLRFEINHPHESIDEFKARCNKHGREDEFEPSGLSTSGYWTIGKNTRDRGSIISDVWKGKAVELASCNYIAIYPTNGWWRTRKHLEAYENVARYTLIVSIYSPSNDIDIYTPVQVQIATPVQIEI